VFNHNIETVPDLYRNVRPGADYQWSLNLLKNFKAQHPDVPTKSGIMLGLGETSSRCRPPARPARARRGHGHHRPVPAAPPTTTRCCYWTPEDYKALEDYGYALGFSHVASGPMVRSSYHADRRPPAWPDAGAKRFAQPASSSSTPSR
jgi:lipoic acid synthetase